MRAYAYLAGAFDFEFVGSLLPDDLEYVTLELYTDADWNGDGSTTKSTDGCWVEISGRGGRIFPIVCRTTRQSFSSSPSAESETAGVSKGICQEGTPVQALLEDAQPQGTSSMPH